MQWVICGMQNGDETVLSVIARTRRQAVPCPLPVFRVPVRHWQARHSQPCIVPVPVWVSLHRQSMTVLYLKRNQRYSPVYLKAGLLRTQRNGSDYRMQQKCICWFLMPRTRLVISRVRPDVPDVSPCSHGVVVYGASLICKSHRRHCSGR